MLSKNVNPSSKSGRRLAVVLSHPTQYYSPWFRWIREHTDIELRVFYLWDFGVTHRRDPQFGAQFKWDVDLLSGYDSEFIPNTAKNPGAEHFFGFRNTGLTKRLGEWRPDALLLYGYRWASHIRVVAWARLHGVPLIFRGDSHLLGRGAPRGLKRLALSSLFSQFASFLYVGAANRDYFTAFGVPGTKLHFAPHSVDAALYDRAETMHAEAAALLRARLGLEPGTRVALFAGKLIPAKQPMELLEAFIKVKAEGAALVIVGDGPEKDRLEQAASADAALAGRRRVFFLPFANQSEMPSRYLLADVFVLPSRGLYETWGLAVNEAMHMGVPCLVSDRVGCQRDLVTQGETGWVFDPADPAGLPRALAEAFEALGSESRREAIRGAVGRRIAGYGYEQTTDGLVAALAALGR
jgi:glycosyltransferase involved in cell wall biosynthesis